MADAPKLLGTDTLRQAYPKFNQAIDNSNEALKKSITAETNSTNAVNTANQAKAKSEETQQQLDTIVIESGTSDAETLQARGGFPLLKDRLDSTDAQLADAVSDIGDISLLSWFPESLTKAIIEMKDWYYQSKINVRTPPYNAKGDGSSSDASVIQQVFNDVKNDGTEIFFPKGIYQIDTSLKVDFRGVLISGVGRGSRLRASQELNGGIIKSISDERVVNTYLENVVIKNLHFDLGSFANTFGIQVNGFTRGCSIYENHFANVKKAAIGISGSWSFCVEKNTVQGTSDKTATGILFADNSTPAYSGSYVVNQCVVSKNTVRSCAVAISVKYGNMNVIDGNTFELNSIDVELFQPETITVSNNYMENCTSRSLYLSGTTSLASNILIVGNFFNASDSAVAEIYINSAKNCRILGNHFRKSNTHLYFATGSKPRVFNNYFEVNEKARIGNFTELDLATNTVYYYNTGNFENLNVDILRVLKELNMTGASPKMKQDTTNDLAEWRIDKIGVEWARVGKLSSTSDEFFFQGSGVSNFRFNKPLKISDKVGFYGTEPISRQGVTGTTDSEKLASLITALKAYGLISP